MARRAALPPSRDAGRGRRMERETLCRAVRNPDAKHALFFSGRAREKDARDDRGRPDEQALFPLPFWGDFYPDRDKSRLVDALRPQNLRLRGLDGKDERG